MLNTRNEMKNQSEYYQQYSDIEDYKIHNSNIGNYRDSNISNNSNNSNISNNSNRGKIPNLINKRRTK